MKIKSQKGYSLIEIGVGILIIGVFTAASFGLFNGAYSNYRIVSQRNIAITHAINYLERVNNLPVRNVTQGEVIENDGNLRIIMTGSSENQGIYMPYSIDETRRVCATITPSSDDYASGNYAVPRDYIVGPTIIINRELTTETNNMIITTKIRRVPTTTSSVVFDARLLKVIVDVQYKIKTTDEEYQTITFETLKVVKEGDVL